MMLQKCFLRSNVPFRIVFVLRNHSTVAIESPVSQSALEKSKPFESIPGPKPLPFIGNVHRYLPGIGEYTTKRWHESQVDKFRKYGGIVREVFLPKTSIVHLYSAEDMETVTRHEGKYPTRQFFDAMRKVREERRDFYHSVGIATGNGEEWHRMRSSTQKVLMRPQVMRQFLPLMNTVGDDMVNRIRRHRQPNHQVDDFIQELFRWAFEAMNQILFRQRMGCLDDDLPPDSMALKYIQALNEFFQTSAKVELATVPIWRIFPSLSPTFQRLKKVHNFFFENAMAYVQEATSRLKLEEELHPSEMSAMQSLLRYCTPEDASIMAIDAMAAGIDTTSVTVAYILRNLAANPNVQKKLYEEINTILPNKKPLDSDTIEKIPYLRACIKESMRLSPTVQGTSRTLSNDIVLSGFRIPANTVMTLNYFVSSLQESNFPQAEKYMPERWLRSMSHSFSAKESFAFQPFGFGPRMCIGRRIADLEMLTLLTKIVQNFWVEDKYPDIDIRFQLVLMIESPLRFEFHDRN